MNSVKKTFKFIAVKEIMHALHFIRVYCTVYTAITKVNKHIFISMCGSTNAYCSHSKNKFTHFRERVSIIIIIFITHTPDNHIIIPNNNCILPRSCSFI